MHQKRGDLPQRFLSTPSARRATFVLHNGFVRSCISIHALREEGDWAALSRLPRPLYFYPRPPRGGRPCIGRRDQVANQFLSTPSARRATLADTVSTYGAFEISIHALREEGDRACRSCCCCSPDISIHALREEGDAYRCRYCRTHRYFYPRPPRGGRLCNAWSHGVAIGISIHALREEGDEPVFCCYRRRQDFYPRPPRGGRPCHIEFSNDDILFLSTPSARRATALVSCHTIPPNISIHALREEGDPLQGRHPHHQDISIHALREEGDFQVSDLAVFTFQFLSTPSARRATLVFGVTVGICKFLSTPSARRATVFARFRPEIAAIISIHALREEGDGVIPRSFARLINFYPRPPRGGRLADGLTASMPQIISIHALREEGDPTALSPGASGVFLSTPSARRATPRASWFLAPLLYFYPRPPRGGRLSVQKRCRTSGSFLSTPSARRATWGGSKGGKTAALFLSTPSARRATLPGSWDSPRC